MGDHGCASFATALSKNVTVTEVGFHRNDISDYGVTKLAKALEDNVTIASLGCVLIVLFLLRCTPFFSIFLLAFSRVSEIF